MKPVLLFAFPTQFEAQGLINKLFKRKRHRSGDLIWFEGELDSTSILVAIIGIGPTHAPKRTERLLDHIYQQRRLQPKLFILSGFAGALASGYQKGDIVIADNPAAGQFLPSERPHFVPMHTSAATLSTAAQKAAIYAQTGALCVDMELRAVAPVVEKWKTPLLCIRAISDLADEDLPIHILRHGYDIERGVPTPGRLARYLLVRPHALYQLLRFVRPLKKVRENLTGLILKIIPTLLKNDCWLKCEKS